MEEQTSGAGQAGKVVLTCESNVDISVAGDLHTLFTEALNGKQTVEIDAENVERIDAAILQLIYLYVKEGEESGVRLSWKGVSESFKSSARLLGMDKRLGLA